MRISGEQGVVGVQTIVESRAQLPAVIGVRENTGQARDGGGHRLYGDDLRLIHVLQIEEEEKLVFQNRPTNIETRITPRKERIGSQRIPAQAGISGHVMVAEEEVTAAVKLI